MEDLINEERKFIHDLASPLVAASFTIETLLEGAKAAPLPDAELIKRLERVFNSLEKASELLRSRRSLLISRQNV